ncbi:hypothetical protein QBC38DRAFT_480751 [Podospora fimiseda]|uniref:Uncharacterized protein n=1 Tax=Podospora fimiseda TaxID=252190 RepID=A0AAN7GXG5_9PEZI|nr:hypothetical protein QBC38DRAFT_480751 [Podospora fimiseda]
MRQSIGGLHRWTSRSNDERQRPLDCCFSLIDFPNAQAVVCCVFVCAVSASITDYLTTDRTKLSMGVSGLSPHLAAAASSLVPIFVSFSGFLVSPSISCRRRFMLSCLLAAFAHQYQALGF